MPLDQPLDAPPTTPAAAPPSAFSPLGQPVFRMLWATWLTANTCMWMNDVAAAWMMTSLTTVPIWVALVQTASTLPVFLFGLPSGALADILDRKRYYLTTQLWLAGIGLVLCAATLAQGMTPLLLLALTFANGIGLAMRWPVFAAIVPELVPRAQLPAALGLGGISMNASRIIGPLVAGGLIASVGSASVFLLNAVLCSARNRPPISCMRGRAASRHSGFPAAELELMTTRPATHSGASMARRRASAPPSECPQSSTR